MIIVGVHLGLHWTRVMAMVHTALRLTPVSSARALVLRAAAAFLASFGLWSCFVLGLGAKLTFTYMDGCGQEIGARLNSVHQRARTQAKCWLKNDVSLSNGILSIWS
jgi:hypothetical protein